MVEVLVLVSSSLLFLSWLDSSHKLLPVSCLENMAAMVLVVQLEKKLEVSEFRFNYSLSTLALSIIPSFSILPDAYIFRDLGFIHSSE